MSKLFINMGDFFMLKNLIMAIEKSSNSCILIYYHLNDNECKEYAIKYENDVLRNEAYVKMFEELNF